VQPRPISQESAKPSASKPKVASPAWYIALKAQVQDLGIPENRQQSAIVKFRAGQLAVAAGAPPERKEDFISQANEEVKGAEAGPVVYPAWYTAMEEELTDLGVPQERMEPAIIKLRAKQLQSEKGLTSEAALLAADKDVKQALRGAPAIPEWVSKVLAEAKELGIPEANHATFLVSQRTLQLGNTPEAKVQAAKEVEEALRHAPQPLLPAQGVSTKPQEAAKTKPAPQTPGAVQDQHPARVQAGDELQTLQKFIDDQQITKKDVANLVGQDPSWVTRILQGTRGKTMGLREKVRNQIVAINAALTEGTNLPVPLPKSERHRRARGGEAGAIPEGSGGALQLVEV
jgi:antitoxin component HigA of HigAB toxin-antitoxin module